MFGTDRRKVLGSVCVVLAFTCLSSMAADSTDALTYVRIYSAKIDAADGVGLAELEAIARAKGSIEVVAVAAGADPAASTGRALVRLGEPGVGCPGLSMSVRGILAAAEKSGKLSADGVTATSSLSRGGAQATLDWSLPQSAGAPLGVTARVSGQAVASTTIHPAGTDAESADKPRVIVTTAPDKAGAIVQVFEYLDGPPEVEAASASPDKLSAAKVKTADAAKGAESDGTTISDGVDFDAELTGWTFDWDTLWWPGEDEEPGAWPLQIRLDIGAGADLSSHVEGDFLLDYGASELTAGSASGSLSIDFGAEFSAQASVNLYLWDPFVFDIPYVPQFDLRVFDEGTFDSFLLDSSVSVADATGRQNVVNVDLVDLVLSGVIEIPGLGGGVSIDADLGASGQMTCESISVTDGNVYVDEGQSNAVTLGPTGYHETASYNEDLEMTATLTAYPVLYIEFLWMRWDLPVFDLPWDIVTGQVDLDFSDSSLDYEMLYRLTVSESNGTWGNVAYDPPPDDANAMEYPAGTAVTLEAQPISGKALNEWRIFDPLHPGDANYVIHDSNMTTTIVMDADREVTVLWKCGSGVGEVLPLLVLLAGLAGFVSRRRRR